MTQQAKVKTNPVKDSVCKIDMPAVKFADLWDNYVTGDPYRDKDGKVPKGYENQCAIRISATFHTVGVKMLSYSQRVLGKDISRVMLSDGKPAAARATDLAKWLKLMPFCGLPEKPENITGKDWLQKVEGRTGIIMFDGYWTRDGEIATGASGGHIDLWNGSKLTGFGTGLRVHWNIVIDGIWSDFRNSKNILFFPIK